ncbi:MAG: RidA family protein [Actinomycetota bacterium]
MTLDKIVLSPSSLGEPIGPFVRGIRVGRLVALSGTSALSHLSGELGERHLDPDFSVQAKLTFENLHRALVAARLDWDHVVKVGVMIKRREDYAELNRLRDEILKGEPTASTTIVCELIREDMLIEVDAWAIAPDDQEINIT